MTWWRKTEPEPVETFSRWTILTNLADGSTMILNGYVYSGMDQAEYLRYVDAVAAGLRAAGFDADVTLTREAEVTR